MARQPMTIFVPLAMSDWCPGKNAGSGYFKCAALGIYGAKAVRLWCDGEDPVSTEAYQVRGRRLYWKRGVPPARMDVELVMRRKLRSPREVFLATVLGILIGGYAVSRHADQLQDFAKRVQTAAVAVVEQTSPS